MEAGRQKRSCKDSTAWVKPCWSPHVRKERTAKRIAKEKPLPELPQEEEGGLMTNPLKEA